MTFQTGFLQWKQDSKQKLLKLKGQNIENEQELSWNRVTKVCTFYHHCFNTISTQRLQKPSQLSDVISIPAAQVCK